MLKIKDNVNLKELEKYGFKQIDFHYKRPYGKKEKYLVAVATYNPFYGRIIFFEKIQKQYFPCKVKKRLIKDLIKDELIEKTEG
ncbi:MAG: hypothetical protein IKT40_03395 [Bacilli bacterium]|nr:hypothetical protein [Bacilli bacterium]